MNGIERVTSATRNVDRDEAAEHEQDITAALLGLAHAAGARLGRHEERPRAERHASRTRDGVPLVRPSELSL